MGLGGRNIGLAGVHSIKKVYKSETVDGFKIKSAMRTWQCNFAGWHIWVDGEKIFRNCLTREEAIQSAISKYKKTKNIA